MSLVPSGGLESDLDFTVYRPPPIGHGAAGHRARFLADWRSVHGKGAYVSPIRLTAELPEPVGEPRATGLDDDAGPDDDGPPVLVELGDVRDVVLGNSSSGNADANSQYYW